MIHLPVYNIENKEIGEMEAPSRLFAVSWKPELVFQALTIQQANSRNTVAHTKGRGEVRGGGKKPWRQKGTGRARHGSSRSPIWIGGGVTHGPIKEKVYTRSINKKMRRLAIFSAISKKLSDKNLKIVEDISFADNKTKNLKKTLANFPETKKSLLLVLSSRHKLVQRTAKNLPGVFCISPKSLNVKDVLRPVAIIIEKEAVQEIISHYRLS